MAEPILAVLPCHLRPPDGCRASIHTDGATPAAEGRGKVGLDLLWHLRFLNPKGRGTASHFQRENLYEHDHDPAFFGGQAVDLRGPYPGRMPSDGHQRERRHYYGEPAGGGIQQRRGGRRVRYRM